MIKKIISSILFSTLVYTSAYNQDNNSKILIYRDYDFFGAFFSHKILINEKVVVKLGNNSFFEYECLPGEYFIQINNYKDSKTQLIVEEGKNYFLRFSFRRDTVPATPELHVSDSLQAYNAIHEGSMRNTGEKEYVSLSDKKNRIGLNINYGRGFDGYPMFITASGIESVISFGGGLAIGAKYGYEFNKYLDLALDFNYQLSKIRPGLKRANMVFNRLYISATPSFILPLGGGGALRLKLGAGPDVYFNNYLTIEGSETEDGFDDIWKYDNTFGFHGTALLEINLSKRWSMNYGVKYYKHNYEFRSSTGIYPMEPKLKTPDGSGMDFLSSFFFHF